MRTFKIVIGVMLMGALGACDRINEYFESAKEIPLPGERISVITLHRALRPDPRITDLSVRLPQPYINEDWPQAGGHPTHAMHHLTLDEAPSQAWRVSAGVGAGDLLRLTAVPIVADQRVYVLDSEGNVAAHRADNGLRLWRYNIVPESEDRGALGGGLAYDRGILYLATGYGEAIALLAENGAEVWRRSIGVPLRGAPTVVNGRFFTVSYDNQLYALNIEDGSVDWSHIGIAEDAGIIGAASPAVEGDVVVAPYSSGELVALRVENGRILWADSLTRTGRSTALAELNDINGSPVIDRDMVIAAGHAGRMVAIDLRSGARLWEQDIASIQTPWVAGDFVFIVTTEAQIVCLARNSGRIRWVQQLPRYEDEERRTDSIEWSGPVLASDRLIVVSSNGDGVAISPYSGDILGQVGLPDGASLSPIVANGTIFVLTDDGDLVAYR
tara:strand:- start:9351 stop:10679 length:1329 start_codon:yes stop_codon:yes gene_type:complete